MLMILPVLLLAFIDPDDAYAWFILGAFILFGGKLIWFATERRWGKFRWNR
jgi:hypothetical protein